jgi:HD-GYP domain-containing protein (c-di-GMP phosphodiesterase class II)
MGLPGPADDVSKVGPHDAKLSATGGSADTQAVDVSGRRWQTRRVTALAIRAVVLVLPFSSALVVGRLLAVALPVPEGRVATVGWWLVVVAGSSIALFAVDRVARRLLPVAMLYRLALVFPDRAPPRYRVALRTGTIHQLRERLDSGGDLGGTPGEAAENLLALVAALGKHDRITRGHSERVRAYSDVIAVEMGLSEADRERLHWAALVHDVGKMAVRPAVLNKAGRPTDEEWSEIRNHPAAAAAMVEPLRPWLGEWLDAATQHHERIDGKGYPCGLAGREISLAGRIVAVADAYDCMTSARSYKKALPADQARYELTRNRGTQFDADVVRALLGVSVGRLHLAGGPLSWFAQIPGAREAITLSGAGGASITAGVASAAVAVVGAVGGFLGPPTEPQPVSAARTAPVELVADEFSGTSSEPVSASDVTATSAIAPVSGPGPTSTPPGGSTARGATATTAPGRASPSTTAPGGTPHDPPNPTTTSASSTSEAPWSTPTTTSASSTTTTIADNQPPNAHNDDADIAILTTSSVLIPVLTNDTDIDGTIDASTLALVTQPPPSEGHVTIVGSQLRYTRSLLTPATSFVYRICDDDGACSQATVTITVSGLI